jgi:hypothetical protein
MLIAQFFLLPAQHMLITEIPVLVEAGSRVVEANLSYQGATGSGLPAVPVPRSG